MRDTVYFTLPKGQNLIVYLPQITFLEMPCKYAWTLKITNIQ